MTKDITVGYDGSVPSSEAVSWAAAEAKARGAKLRIVSCYEIPYAAASITGWAATEAYDALLDGCRKGLAEMGDIVARTAPGIDIDLEPSAGPAASVLVENLESDDLVVVGASSHEGVAAFWLGSTPRHVVRHSPCPVVVVRGVGNRGGPDRVVVGIDGSPESRDALRWAGNEAELHGVGLLVVHAWMYPYLTVDTASAQARDLANIDAACVLERAVESAREEFGIDVDGELVEAGPLTALLETVRDGDLLVVGSRGRGAFSASHFGYTVKSVLDRSPVPVVVVRGVDENVPTPR